METEGEQTVRESEEVSEATHTHMHTHWMGQEQDANSKRLQRGRWQANSKQMGVQGARPTDTHPDRHTRIA